VSNRDYPVVQGIVFVMGILVVVVNLVADLASGALDPRARTR
jgi:peptide/nickel transport system permease protein